MYFLLLGHIYLLIIRNLNGQVYANTHIYMYIYIYIYMHDYMFMVEKFEHKKNQ